MVAEQIELPQMPRRLFSATPSRLSTWLDCPRRYRFTYVDRPQPAKGPPWAHNAIGAAVHVALAEWWSLPLRERTAVAAADLVRARWQPLGFRDDEQASAWCDRSAEMVEAYAATLDPAHEPVGVERTVAMRTSGLALSGRIDRLDERAEGLVVVDYKTGRRILSTDDARGSLALAIYAAAASRTLRKACIAVELHHLPTGDVIRWEHTPESLDRHLRRAQDIADEIVAAQASDGDPDECFPTRPGPQCGWCDFATACPVGRDQSRAMSWAGLAEDRAPLEESGFILE